MWTEALALLCLSLLLPGSLYLGLLSLAALRPPRTSEREPARPAQLVVLVPAHDEEAGLARTLRSLRAERERAGAAAGLRIVVVADNCSDATATVARAEGAEVLERRDPLHRGKGYALAYAFERLAEADWFIVIDADSDVEPGFLVAMRAAMHEDRAALQCRYGVRDPLSSRRATLADVALAAWNVLRPRGRAALGLSCGILGNGFALSRRTLARVPYAAHSIVEDVEYHQLLLQAGLRVHWVDEAGVRGDMPAGDAAAARQRARWEGGRLRLILTRAPRLLLQLLRGHWRLADPLLDLLTLPLAWHCSLLLLAALLGAASGHWTVTLALAGLAGLGLHVAIALRLLPAGRAHWRALLGVPAYLLWKLGLAGATLAAARRNDWVRSERETR
ncbi:MAG: glycosyltransferase family 2 protein [Roseateles sp.]